MDYYNGAKQAKKRLESISPTMCMAKWLQTSIHLPQALTQSCYHPPPHKNTCRLSYSTTSQKLAGSPIHITPVIIQQIVMPLKRVSISPMSGI